MKFILKHKGIKTAVTGSPLIIESGSQVFLKTTENFDYDFTIKYYDSDTETNIIIPVKTSQAQNIEIPQFPAQVNGIVPQIQFIADSIEISSFGDLQFSSFESMFENLQNGSALPDMLQLFENSPAVFSVKNMFKGCSNGVLLYNVDFANILNAEGLLMNSNGPVSFENAAGMGNIINMKDMFNGFSYSLSDIYPNDWSSFDFTNVEDMSGFLLNTDTVSSPSVIMSLIERIGNTATKTGVVLDIAPVSFEFSEENSFTQAYNYLVNTLNWTVRGISISIGV